ncbi:uncharacterized protein TNCV_3834251 [Trichonephila clavipes]|nr:uncharacterized protein TNCV_3834251 [Trichonephila clavipes]
MDDLPKERITPDKVFNSTGIDLCGPFFIKNKYQRKDRWIPRGVSFQRPRHRLIAVASLGRLPRNRSIPVCFTRYPQTALSDRWRSLGITSLMNIGGIRYVHTHSYSIFICLVTKAIHLEIISDLTSQALIAALKRFISRRETQKFSYEELLTLITQIEAILNSRPLTPLSSDVDDLEVLTPAHFLIGRPITAIVEPSLLQCESNRLNVWQRITKSVQTIWKRWSLSYLNSLQQRKKWIVNKENLKLGDMVLIREENLPPCKWLLGRVVKIYMGKDKKVRVVDIKTGKGIYKRSINRLSILPIEN